MAEYFQLFAIDPIGFTAQNDPTMRKAQPIPLNANAILPGQTGLHGMHQKLSGIALSAGISIIIAFAISAIANIDPLGDFWGLGGLKYSVIAFLLIGGVMLIVDGSGTRYLSNRAIIFALAFFTWEIIGSIIWIALYDGEINSSYLTRGIIGFSIIAGTTAAANVPLFRWICHNTLRIWLISSIIIATLLTAHTLGIFLPNQRQVYHVEFVFAVATLSFYFNSKNWVGARMVLVLICIYNAFAAGKSTFYLLAIIVLLMGFGAPAVSRLKAYMLRGTAKARITIGLLIAPIILSILTISISIVGLIVSERSSRYENDFRRMSYNLRLDQFWEDPILGKLFIDTTDVGQRVGLRNVPSHNDLLDILAAGGLVGLILFLIPMASALLGSAGQKAMSSSAGSLRYSDFLWYLLVFYAISAMGNPFLGVPVFAGPIWFAVGALLVRNHQLSRRIAAPSKN